MSFDLQLTKACFTDSFIPDKMWWYISVVVKNNYIFLGWVKLQQNSPAQNRSYSGLGMLRNACQVKFEISTQQLSSGRSEVLSALWGAALPQMFS